MVVSVLPMGDVKITWEGLAPNGVYVWVAEVPVSIRYTAHTENSPGNRQEGIARLTISRVPTTNSPRGIAIQTYRVIENR